MVWGNLNNTNNNNSSNNAQFKRVLQQLRDNSIESLFLISSFVPVDSNNAPEFASGLLENESLTELYISGHNFGEEGSKLIGRSLGSHPRIRSLSLGYQGIDRTHLHHLLQQILASSSIRHLDLSKLNSTSLCNVLVDSPQSSSLTSLDISYNQLNSTSLLDLSDLLLNKCPRLMALNISNNPFSTDNSNSNSNGIQQFINSIITQNSITRLNLSNTKFLGNCLNEISRLFTTSEFNSLKDINLNECNINDDDEGIEEFGRSIISWKNGESISLQFNPNINFKLTNSWEIGTPREVYSPTPSNLKQILLRGCSIGDKGLENIVKSISDGILSCLQHLDIGKNEITVKGLSSMGPIITCQVENQLEHLDISFNHLKSDIEICDWIKSENINKLKNLYLNSTGMEFNQIANICKHLVQFKTSISSFDIIHDQNNQNNNNNINNNNYYDEEEEDEEEELDPILIEFYENIDILKEEKQLEVKWK
eukprot:gene4605-5752_t